MKTRFSQEWQRLEKKPSRFLNHFLYINGQSYCKSFVEKMHKGDVPVNRVKN